VDPIAIPHGAYWCTPFVRWQGSFAHLHSLRFAAHVARGALAARRISPEAFDHGALGLTVPQVGSFYGLPWLAGELGAPQIAGPTIMQACATSARLLAHGTREIQSGSSQCMLAIATDRVSNGPHIYYPNPRAAGGTGETEDWVLANFARDPYAGCGMVETAERCAAEAGISMSEQHDLVLRRYAQYTDALQPGPDGRTFQQRYMVLPFAVPNERFDKSIGELAGDEGVHRSTAEGLARLKPVQAGGTVTYGAQTHPADGNAGMVLTTVARAREFAQDPGIRIGLRGFGECRTARGWMPKAPIEAARRALEAAGIGIPDLAAIKSHNPFAVNDLLFARATGAALDRMNNFGCSLIWGHPQAPTGLRAIIELIEELILKGGGWGLFHGCAAGDSAMAVVLRVD
jgi:acetyl-CoA acetyltransferase